jgi:hypothetical protein
MQRMTLVYEEALRRKAQGRGLTQGEYDGFERDYRGVGGQLDAFFQSVRGVHRDYCRKFVTGDRKDDDDDAKDSPFNRVLMDRRQSIARMNEEIRYIMHFAAKMKRHVDESFLTAKFLNLYGGGGGGAAQRRNSVLYAPRRY